MTVTYSLDVADTHFCGFAKLLCRWKGSIYKILWKELLVFAFCYMIISVTYRNFLNEDQKRVFEDVVIYCETFVDVIPLSFVLGFYVSIVIGRWWEQFKCIPFPDSVCLMISAFIQGSDERTRIIRRSLGRYLILVQVLTFRCVSTAVKKRFPTTAHLENAGLMTSEERAIFESFSAPFGKWWLPCHWFTSLVVRARKEGKIKDSILFKTLLERMFLFRGNCGQMFSYDWISIPLVYTQVVTLATYTYAIALLLGRQYINPSKGFKKHGIDLYIPFFTFLQFFFYVGWLKVSEQLVNPYGDDDDDFELNWVIDRCTKIMYDIVDYQHSKHPKLKKDPLWDIEELNLPHTKYTINNLVNPQLGSTVNLEVDPSAEQFVPMETLLEDDIESVDDESVKRFDMRRRPSLLMSILENSYGKSKNSHRKASVSHYVNQAYSPDVIRRRKFSMISPFANPKFSPKLSQWSRPCNASQNSGIANRYGNCCQHRSVHVHGGQRPTGLPQVGKLDTLTEVHVEDDPPSYGNPLPNVPEQAGPVNEEYYEENNDSPEEASEKEDSFMSSDNVRGSVKETSKATGKINGHQVNECEDTTTPEGYEPCCHSSESKEDDERIGGNDDTGGKLVSQDGAAAAVEQQEQTTFTERL